MFTRFPAIEGSPAQAEQPGRRLPDLVCGSTEDLLHQECQGRRPDRFFAGVREAKAAIWFRTTVKRGAALADGVLETLALDGQRQESETSRFQMRGMAWAVTPTAVWVCVSNQGFQMRQMTAQSVVPFQQSLQSRGRYHEFRT